MGVYVDSVKPCVLTNYWRWAESCHLIADSVYELHRFAEKLGLKKEWFQEKPSPHYDLTRSKRAKAVELGAIEVNIIELAEIIQRNRRKVY